MSESARFPKILLATFHQPTIFAWSPGARISRITVYLKGKFINLYYKILLDVNFNLLLTDFVEKLNNQYNYSLHCYTILTPAGINLVSTRTIIWRNRSHDILKKQISYYQTTSLYRALIVYTMYIDIIDI